MTHRAKLLRIYLQDLDAALLVTPSVARRSAKPNRGTPLGDLLSRLIDEFAADHRALDGILKVLDVRPSRVKRALTWGSGLGRMKLNGRLIKYSPLSRVYELQALTVLVALKRTLWETLQDNYGDRLTSLDLDGLIKRANRQLAELEPHLRKAAATALKSD